MLEAKEDAGKCMFSNTSPHQKSSCPSTAESPNDIYAIEYNAAMKKNNVFSPLKSLAIFQIARFVGNLIIRYADTIRDYCYTNNNIIVDLNYVKQRCNSFLLTDSILIFLNKHMYPFTHTHHRSYRLKLTCKDF